jgi:hypothetical protein
LCQLDPKLAERIEAAEHQAKPNARNDRVNGADDFEFEIA